MTREQWTRLKTLFHGALEQPAETRLDWLTRAAAGDEMLAREAAGLVAAHETADGFLETSAVFDPADIAAAELLEPGTRIGSYEIEREIGVAAWASSMPPRDLRLERRVALKALPPLHDGDAAKRERLRREARAAATISHPAVATVYALEEIEGRLFIASEFVDGHTLRSEIEQAPLEPSRALAVAADIARALGGGGDRVRVDGVARVDRARGHRRQGGKRRVRRGARRSDRRRDAAAPSVVHGAILSSGA